MKLGIVMVTKEPERAWNAVRLANFALKAGDQVQIFLIGEGVEAAEVNQEPFAVRKQLEEFLAAGGKIMACGTCLKLRKKGESELCPFSTLKDLHQLVKEADKVLVF